MNECKDCLSYRTEIISGRLREYCNRNGSETAFMRDKHGECGEGGELFMSAALPSCRTLEEGRFA